MTGIMSGRNMFHDVMFLGGYLYPGKVVSIRPLCLVPRIVGEDIFS